jgi:hypothetical protein
LEKNLFEGLTKLSFLGLSHNKLFNLTNNIFAPLNQTLKILYLKNNQIESIDQSGIECLSKLEELNLSDNKLKLLPINVFLKIPLKYLNLRGNQLEWLEHIGLEKQSKLKQLYLGQNKYIFGHISNRNGPFEFLINNF